MISFLFINNLINLKLSIKYQIYLYIILSAFSNVFLINFIKLFFFVISKLYQFLNIISDLLNTFLILILNFTFIFRIKIEGLFSFLRIREHPVLNKFHILIFILIKLLVFLILLHFPYFILLFLRFCILNHFQIVYLIFIRFFLLPSFLYKLTFFLSYELSQITALLLLKPDSYHHLISYIIRFLRKHDWLIFLTVELIHSVLLVLFKFLFF